MTPVAIVGSKGSGVKTAINYLLHSGYTLAKFNNNKLIISNKNFIVVNNCISNENFNEIRKHKGIIVRIVRHEYPILKCTPNITLINNRGILDLHQALNIYVLFNIQDTY